MKLLAVLAVLLGSSIANGVSLAVAQENPQSWSEVKCARYKKGWSDALARGGTRGLGREFLDSHEAFLASVVGREPVSALGPRRSWSSRTS